MTDTNPMPLVDLTEELCSAMRIRDPIQALQYIGRQVTWFNPLGCIEPRTDTLANVMGVSVLLDDRWHVLGHIWMEPAASFKDQRFAPERKGAWARIRSFLQSLTKL
jgi:hypothetical protein